MFEFFSKLFGFVEVAPADKEARLLAAAIEAVVDGTDPRLRALSDYQDKLRQPTQTAIDYVRHMAAHLGEPIELTRANFAADARIHLLFGRADAIGELLGRDEALRQFKETFPSSDYGYAVLTARRQEKHTLGMQMMGEVLQNDVQQTVLNFKEHRLMALAPSAQESLTLIKRSAFLYQVHCALAAVTALKNHDGDRAAQLLQERMVAMAQYHGSSATEPWPHMPTTRQPDLEAKLQQLDQRLRDCQSAPCNIDDYLSVVMAVMSHPERYLRQAHYHALVDRLGIVLSSSSSAAIGAERITLPEVHMADKPMPLLTLPVKIPWAEIPSFQGLRTDLAVF